MDLGAITNSTNAVANNYAAKETKQADEVKKYGDKYVIDIIDYSMGQNYIGVFPPKNNAKGATNEVDSGDNRYSDIKGVHFF
jgi:hypothetical protein